jgi:hypothetical protein
MRYKVFSFLFNLFIIFFYVRWLEEIPDRKNIKASHEVVGIVRFWVFAEDRKKGGSVTKVV